MTTISTWQNGARLQSWLACGMLFTEAAEQWSGEEIRSAITQRTARSPLTAAEHRDLESWRDGISAGWRREGVLMTATGRRAAQISAVYLPARIGDQDVIAALQCTDVPLGRALRSLGVRRSLLSCDLRASGPFAVEASGCLLLGDLPVAFAREQVFREFAR
ncbi:MAG TPA: hypothetical protein VGG75_04915 [Trebonia sp.]